MSEIASFLSRTRTPLLLADDERRCVDANFGACRLLGVSRRQLIARPIDAWMTAADRQRIRIVWADLLGRGTLTGSLRLRVPGRREAVVIEFTATAHLAPGRHLVVLGPHIAAGSAVTADHVEPAAMSAREREVMELVAAGATTDDVATQLIISRETARRHVKNAMTKLGAHTRAQAVATAFRRGELSA